MNTAVAVILALVVLAILAGLGLYLFTRRTALKVEAAMPPRGRFVEVPGGRIHYAEKGSGPPVVMIHGLGGNLMNFTHSMVARIARDHRVIALDRPGSGYSTRADDGDASLRAQAQMIAACLDALDVGPALVVGHSLGGAVSLALALDHPERVAGLALLAPLTQSQDEVPDLFKGLAIPSPTMRRLVAHTLATPLAIRNRQAVMGTVFGPNEVPADFATLGGGLLGLRPESFYATSTDLMAVNDDLPSMQVRYGGITVPVGIFYGTGDRVLDPGRNGAAMQRVLPQLDYETHDGLGHMVQFSMPDAVEAFIRRMAEKALAPAPAEAVTPA